MKRFPTRSYFGVSAVLMLLVCSDLYGSDRDIGSPAPPVFPVPAFLSKYKETDHFDCLLENIGDDSVLFSYLKTRYFTIPALRPGLFPPLRPEPADGITKLEKTANDLYGELVEDFGDFAENGDLVPATLADRRLRRWILLTGALAYSKRVVNGIGDDDGGKEYLRVFRLAPVLAKDPALFGLLVEDYCQIAGRPLRSRKPSAINHSQESLAHFVAPFILMSGKPEDEPNLGRLYPWPLWNRFLEEPLEAVAAKEKVSDVAALRLARLLAEGFDHDRRNRPPKGIKDLDVKCVAIALKRAMDADDFRHLPFSLRQKIQQCAFDVDAFGVYPFLAAPNSPPEAGGEKQKEGGAPPPATQSGGQSEGQADGRENQSRPKAGGNAER